MTTTTPARRSPATAPQKARPVAWRTVALAAAAVYLTGGLTAAAITASTPADPAVKTVCLHGISVIQTTEPGGRITLTAPSDLPACTSSHGSEDK